MISCPTCAFINEEGTAFCIQCGHDFTITPSQVKPEQSEGQAKSKDGTEKTGPTGSEETIVDAPNSSGSDEPEDTVDRADPPDTNQQAEPLDTEDAAKILDQTAKESDVVTSDENEELINVPGDEKSDAEEPNASDLGDNSNGVENGETRSAMIGNSESISSSVDRNDQKDEGSSGIDEVDLEQPGSEGIDRADTVRGDVDSQPEEEKKTLMSSTVPDNEGDLIAADEQSAEESSGLQLKQEQPESANCANETSAELEARSEAVNEKMNSDPLASLPPPPASSAVSPLQFADAGEAAFGERWWLKPSATGASVDDGAPQTAPLDVVDTFQTDEDDQTDPKVNRPAHIPMRAAAEVDRRRFEELPTVSDTERKPTALIIGVVVVIVAAVAAFLKLSGG